MTNSEFAEKFKKRTKQFALRILKLYQKKTIKNKN